MKKFLVVAMFGFALIGQAILAADGKVEFLEDASGLKNGAYLQNVPKPSKQYNIANITRTFMNAHWVKNKEGFEAAAKHYGVNGNVFAVQSEQDVMDQANILDTVIERRFDAIAVSPITEQNLLPSLKKASDAGITIINIDTAEILEKDALANGITLTAFIGSNNYDAGVLAARFMSEKFGGQNAEVAVIEGNPGDTCAIDRTNGFTEESKKLPNLKLVASQTAKWDRLQALEVTTSILRANPNVRGIYCNNDTMVLGAMQAATDLGYTILTSDNLDRAGQDKTLLLVGNDGVPEALEAVRDGALTGTIAQKPYLMGYAAIEASIQALEGKKPEKRIATPIKLVLKNDWQ
ncbi:MAG: substrate-binding domain-containing protein [Planctomycetes bacterium]|nr:substrate-binding domain-containing protein [Planctomycetota bacterium]